MVDPPLLQCTVCQAQKLQPGLNPPAPAAAADVMLLLLLVLLLMLPNAAAVAPPGSYLYLGVGKLCPQGTYQPDYNTMTFCHSCPTGLTTEGEGHNSSTDCTLAMKGYYIVNGSAAAPCPVGTYSDQEGAVTQCTACPYGESHCHSIDMFGARPGALHAT